MINLFKTGDTVYKNYPFDGSPKQGYPDKKRLFVIEKIIDHEPVDGPRTKNAVCFLKPGISWDFHWNLSKTF